MLQSIGFQPGVREEILEDKQKHVTSIETKHRNSLNLEAALIVALNEDSSLN
jgi:hypothetical protein